MFEGSLIPEESKAMIGNEEGPKVIKKVTESDIRRFAQAAGDTNPLYLDEEYAGKSRYGGIIAPPLFYSALRFEGDVPESGLNPDGTPIKGEMIPPLRTTRKMHGATEVELYEPIRPGDVISAKRKLADIYEKQGRTGRLTFTVLETTYTNQNGQVVVVERETRLGRE